MWGVLATSLFFLPFNRTIAWLALAVSVGMGIYHQILTPLSLSCMAVIFAAAWLRHHYREQRNVALPLELFLVASCVALFYHLLPGFNNPLMVNQAKAGPLSSAYSMYYNFDKALLPLILFACMPTLFNAAKADKTVGNTAWVILVLCIPAVLLVAMALGALRIELHMPDWILAFILANFFFVAVVEEALFRGYLQQRLSQKFGAYPALVIASLLFGLAHLPAGMLMVTFATLAGVIYGLAWMWSGRLWIPIALHFALNLLHLLFFTYPQYQPA